jgi:predicted O-methyltransferase YrrM
MTKAACKLVGYVCRVAVVVVGGASEGEAVAEHWGAVDAYLDGLLVREGAELRDALAAGAAAGLPPHGVAPNQGKLLQLLAQAIGARSILELGTLAGYSTIWLAQALLPGGRLITLEANAAYAAVARGSIERAGLDDLVDVRIGPALETLPELAAAGAGPFDLVFIDADKKNNPRYLPLVLELSRVGTLIVADNVIREGTIVDPSGDATVQGVRSFFELVSREPRLSATAIQTVGSKGYDGFMLALVLEPTA